MLVRINSGAGGIVEYLESGRKKGREFDRDLIDERVPLDGDIDLMREVINDIEPRQEGDSRYLHITLGFAEQFTASHVCGPGQINAQRLHEIVQAFRDAVMAAYEPGEYLFYAEAHIPKVTHELNARSGQYESRLPHVHIVIPMRNLETDRFMDPFGYLHDMSVPDAIQEQINQRFGLRSPKRSRRDPAALVHPLIRHGAVLEGHSPKQLRAYLAALVANRQVESFEALLGAAAELGSVTVRQGRDDEYINVKPHWAARGINIKDLGRKNFDATAATLRAAPAPVDYDGIVAKWCSSGAYEARYLTSPKLKKAYKAMSEEERAAFIKARRLETRARLAAHEESMARQMLRASGEVIERVIARFESHGVSVERLTERRIDARRPQRQLEPMAQRPSEPASDAQLRAQTDPCYVIAAARDRFGIDVRDCQIGVGEDGTPRIGVGARQYNLGDFLTKHVKLAWSEAREVLVDCHAQTNFVEAKPVPAAATSAPKERRSRTVIEAIADSARPSDLSAERLKANTNPRIVLTTAERLYKIAPAEYALGTGEDGTPRIIHKNKQYNLADFLTKHLQRSWEEAQSVLRDCYYASQSDALPPPDPQLWRQFSAWRHRQVEELSARRVQNAQAFRKRVLQSREAYERSKASAQPLPASERGAAIARARADRFIAQQAIAAERAEASMATRIPNRNAHYRQFLSDLAQGGDALALAELRRMAPHEKELGAKVFGERSEAVFALPTYSVDAHGGVTYHAGGEAIVRDAVQGVTVLKAQAAAYDAAIRIAVARYGGTLTLRGDERFMAGMTEAARRTGMELRLRDESRPMLIPVYIRGRSRTGPELER